LKVIFSGRPFDADLLKLKPEELRIDELPNAAARQLLVRQGLTPALAHQIVNSRLLPRRPLELKLLAKAVAGDSDFSVQDLEDELLGLQSGAQNTLGTVE